MNKKFLLFGLLLLCAAFILKIDKKLDLKVEANSIVETCKISSDKESCYSQEFLKFDQKHNFPEVIKTLEIAQTQDKFLNNCHFLSHKIGFAEFKKLRSLDFLAAIDPQICGRGFYHGAIEGAQTLDPNFKLTENSIRDLCNELATKAISENIGLLCVHAIGHIVLVEKNGKIPDALDLCSKLDSESKGHCYVGVFMEYIEKTNLIQHGLASEPLQTSEGNVKDLENLCQKLKDEQKNSCWDSISQMYLKVAGYERHTLKERCSRSDTTEGSIRCYLNGATTIIILKLRNGEDEIENWCEPFNDDRALFERCVKRVISDVLGSSKENRVYLEKYCNSLIGDLKNNCLKSL